MGFFICAIFDTKPDKAFPVSIMSHYFSNHDLAHWQAIKKNFYCLCGTINLKLTYKKSIQPLKGFSNAD